MNNKKLEIFCSDHAQHSRTKVEKGEEINIKNKYGFDGISYPCYVGRRIDIWNNKELLSSISRPQYKHTIGTKMNCSKNGGTSNCSNRSSCRRDVENSRAGIEFNTRAKLMPPEEVIEIKITFD